MKRIDSAPAHRHDIAPGTNVGMGIDHTIYATATGTVEFKTRANDRTYVSVRPAEAAE